MIKWDLFQICKDGSTLCKLINMKHHINKMKAKYHMIILIDEEKLFTKINIHLLLKKKLSIKWVKRETPQHHKAQL